MVKFKVAAVTSLVSELLTHSSTAKQATNPNGSNSAPQQDGSISLKFKGIVDGFKGPSNPAQVSNNALDSEVKTIASELEISAESGNSLPLNWLNKIEQWLNDGEYSTAAGEEPGVALGLTQQQIVQLESAIKEIASVKGLDGNEKGVFEAIESLKRWLSPANTLEQSQTAKNLGVALSELQAFVAKDGLNIQESKNLNREANFIQPGGLWNKPEFLGDKVTEQKTSLLPSVKLSDGQTNPTDKAGGAGFWLGLSKAEVDAAENKFSKFDLDLKVNKVKQGTDYAAQLQTLNSTVLEEDGLPMTKSKFDWHNFKLDSSQNPPTFGSSFLTVRHPTAETRNEPTTIALEALRPSTSVESSVEAKATRGSESVMSNPLVMHSKQWQQDFTQKIQWMTHGKLDKAEIQMDPQELGPLTIRVAQSNGELQVTVQASHSQTRELFELNQERLRELFQEQGLNLSQFDVQSEQREATDDSAEAQGDSDLNSSESIESESEVTAVSTLLPNGRLDYFV